MTPTLQPKENACDLYVPLDMLGCRRVTHVIEPKKKRTLTGKCQRRGTPIGAFRFWMDRVVIDSFAGEGPEEGIYRK